MLYAYQVYEQLLDLIRKDKRGRTITPEEFNSLAPIVNETVFSKFYSQFESTPENSDKLGDFRVIGESVAIAGGVGALPVSYYAMSGKPYYTDTAGVVRYLDMVSDMEHAWRQGDYLTQASLTHPTYRLGTATSGGAKQIFVSPTTGVNPIYVDYIRVPNTPILDYYLNDTTLNYTWMATGVNVSVPAGSTAMNGTAGAALVASTTINWEFDNEDLPLIISLFLQYAGIQIPDPTLYEGGTLQEQKISNA